MKISLITLHRTFNIGSSLQAFALYKFLKDNGYDASVIDYVPTYSENEGNRLKELIKKTLYLKKYHIRHNRFEKFLAKNVVMSKQHYTNNNQIQEQDLDSDVFITGSDQLWNTSYLCGKDLAYYLSFVSTKKKMAYAVSLGEEVIPDHELQWIGNQIQDFTWISVRESSSVSNLAKVTQQKVECVCDPTLLLPMEQYDALIDSEPKDRIYKENYVFVYLVEKNDLLDQAIDILRTKMNYKIVLFGGFSKRCYCDLHVTDAGPTEFLSWIKNAKIVIASSFHAAMFSHIYRKNFVIILPTSNKVRIEDFVKRVGTQDRIIYNDSDVNKVLTELDYSAEIETKINDFITFSKNEFMNQLSLCEV